MMVEVFYEFGQGVFNLVLYFLKVLIFNLSTNLFFLLKFVFLKVVKCIIRITKKCL